MKKIALFWAFQFQFNCGTCWVRQLSSLKLPMNSQCIQPTISKSISVSNVRADFPIYIARQSATLTKLSKWCFVWQCEYGCLLLHTEILILLQKFLFYTDCLDSCWSIAVKKRNDIPSQKGLSNYYSKKHNTYSRHVLLSKVSAIKASWWKHWKMFVHALYVCWYTFPSNKSHSNYVWTCYHILPNSTNMDRP